MAEVWGAGTGNEPYVGRWSRLVAAEFLDWLGMPAGRRWVEVGCGTGALTRAILSHGDPERVLAVDPSHGYVAWASADISDPRVVFRVGDVAVIAAEAADVVVSGLVLNFLPDPSAAATVMRNVAGVGVVAGYVWDYAGRMELIRHFWDAAVEKDPGVVSLDEGVRFGCHPERLEMLWRGAGLVDVSCRAIDVTTTFRDFDDYWQPFLGGQGPAPGYAMSLDESARSRLCERLRGRLPVAADGSISLRARAWAVRGHSAQS